MAEIEELAISRAEELYASKSVMIGEENFKNIERTILLRTVDINWMEHLDAMDDLRGGVGLNAYAHRNPLTEYRIIGGDMFDSMVSSIRENTVRSILSLNPKENVERKSVVRITGMSGGGTPESSKQSNKPTVKGPGTKKSVKVGANEDCPCGSGKKYKKCCALKSDGSN